MLGRETGALLTGERTNRSRIKKIKEILTADPSVERVGELLTMQLGPEQALLTARLTFRPGLSVRELESVINHLKERIQKQDASIAQILVEPVSRAESPVAPKAA